MILNYGDNGSSSLLPAIDKSSGWKLRLFNISHANWTRLQPIARQEQQPKLPTFTNPRCLQRTKTADGSSPLCCSGKLNSVSRGTSDQSVQMSHHTIATITVNIDSLTSPCERLIQVLQLPYLRDPSIVKRQRQHQQSSRCTPKIPGCKQELVCTESNTSEEAESAKGRAELKIRSRAEQERHIMLRCQSVQAPGPAEDAEYICCIIAAYPQHHVYGPCFPFFCQPANNIRDLIRARCFDYHSLKLEDFEDTH